MKNNPLDQSQVSSSEMNIQIQEDKLSTSKSVGESAGELKKLDYGIIQEPIGLFTRKAKRRCLPSALFPEENADYI